MQPVAEVYAMCPVAFRRPSSPIESLHVLHEKRSTVCTVSASASSRCLALPTNRQLPAVFIPNASFVLRNLETVVCEECTNNRL